MMLSLGGMGNPDNMAMRLFPLSLQIGFNLLEFDCGDITE